MDQLVDEVRSALMAQRELNSGRDAAYQMSSGKNDGFLFTLFLTLFTSLLHIFIALLSAVFLLALGLFINIYYQYMKDASGTSNSCTV